MEVCKMKVKIEQGKVTIGRHDLRDKIAKCKDGYYSIKIKGWDRSLAQNNYYWSCITLIGEELGYTKEELHEIMLDMFAPIMTYRDLNNKPKQRKIRSSEMSTKEMSEYMNHIDRFAAEQNIILPQPEN
jgi:hypothetical protein